MIFQILCPCGCKEAVEANDAGFSATTCSVKACSNMAPCGIVSYEIRKTKAYEYAERLEAGLRADYVRHQNGLVWLES